MLKHQRNQLRSLVSLETELRELLISHPWGPGIYKDFVKFICEKKKNILAARPYFRERQSVFTAHISQALAKRQFQGLYRFRFNWSFIEFVVRGRKWPAGGKVVALVTKIAGIRRDLLEQNLPLAISQARAFWGHTPKSHLSYMDIVQIQCQGLLLAIDKFVPPRNVDKFSERRSLEAYRKFRAVAIGIMTRDRVNEYSATLMHFFPKDRAKMYAANKLLRRTSGSPDWEGLADAVNQRLDDPACRTTGDELSALLAAGSTVSGDSKSRSESGEEGETSIEAYYDVDALRFDEVIEKEQSIQAVRNVGRRLDLRSRKLLKMKGIKL